MRLLIIDASGINKAETAWNHMTAAEKLNAGAQLHWKCRWDTATQGVYTSVMLQ